MTKTPPLAKAKALAPQLNAASDALNKKITEFEKALSALGLGVSARVLLYFGECEEESTHLEFSKWGDSWRLLVVEVDGDEERKTPLLNASRRLRIDAASVFSALIDELVLSASNEVALVDATSADISALISTITESKP